ncbi:hypothetical protein E2C01_054134 [Portunus trituberculatus]|uniref:Uncharacterized protein n=1 Tax=Portunus trituberculatus TaxID=210409 RepID=A0A5B7GSD1_PORTR|nr:hypothetical protein [Portunus trituberculatus]
MTREQSVSEYWSECGPDNELVLLVKVTLDELRFRPTDSHFLGSRTQGNTKEEFILRDLLDVMRSVVQLINKGTTTITTTSTTTTKPSNKTTSPASPPTSQPSHASKPQVFPCSVRREAVQYTTHSSASPLPPGLHTPVTASSGSQVGQLTPHLSG